MFKNALLNGVFGAISVLVLPFVSSNHITLGAAAPHEQVGQLSDLPPGIDAALGASIQVSGESGDLSSMVDGDASTTWFPNRPGSYVVQVKLQRPVTITGVCISWPEAYDSAMVQVQVSVNDNTWFGIGGRETAVPISSSIQVLEPLRPIKDIQFVKIIVRSPDNQKVGISEIRVFSPESYLTRRMMLGDDISTMLQEESIGNHYYLGTQAMPLPEILRLGGANYIRMRLWVNPPKGYNNLKYDLTLAQIAKVYGLRIFLDIHYSDFWADPSKQYIPKAWANESFSQLETTVENYTKEVLSSFAKQGTPVDMVSIGNEITDGFLWPYGQIYLSNGTQNWTGFTDLLKAAIKGAEQGNPSGHKLLIMLHTDRGGDNAGEEYFLDHVLQYGVRFDVIGLSYYPWFHGPLSGLINNVDSLAEKYNKPIVIAETQYPWTLEHPSGDPTPNQVTSTTPLPPGYPPTPLGQELYVRDLVSILAHVPKNLGLGVFYWEPGWLPGVGWEPGAGTSAANLTEFNWQGEALPSIYAYDVG
ncbi:glycosyl hydrolase 53 family protein [Alicyclobacillus sendaiensis]|uniref:glycosyl hydrolase 53 family protein n=1 Tax=Alicyclobacillus sendaiensis TaxID=192387 RepID=UPI0009FA8F7B|nr:glycosyl hydrolase 53 family protein [Alicyclobacillus sendaiensis]